MQAAQKLDDILASAPQSGAVDLSRHQIDDLGALLPRLAELTQLRRLDLSGNALSHLPQDIGLALPALAALDIRANRFRAGGVDDLIPALLSLPSLESLALSASEEEEERVVVALPDLLELNGTPLTLPEEEEEEEEEAQRMAASGGWEGQLQQQQQQQQQQQSHALGVGDLRGASPATQHSFQLQPSPTHAAAGLSHGGMSNLPPVHASPSAPMNASGGGSSFGAGMAVGASQQQQQQQQAASSSTFAVRSDHAAHQQAVRGAEVAMSGGDLEAVSQLFGSIAALRAGLEPGAEQTLQERYERHMQQTLHGLEQQLQHISDPFLKQGEILRAKHQLYEVCFGETIAMIAPTAPAFGEVLRRIRRVHTTLFEEVPAVIRAAVPAREAELDALRRDVGRAEDETRQLLAAAELLEHEAVSHSSEQLKLRASHEQTVKENARLRRAEKELQAQLRRARAEKDAGGGGGGGGGGRGGARGGVFEASLSLQPAGAAPEAGAAAQDGGREAASSSAAQTQQTQVAASAQQAPTPQPVRAISLKQLKDHMELVYASKVKFDHKCAAAHLPRETMEQHMYTYLNQRYGLKPLIVDHASAIIKAVNKCAPQDNDVAVFGKVRRAFDRSQLTSAFSFFCLLATHPLLVPLPPLSLSLCLVLGKVLRNEVDEEFRFVQQQLKQTVRDLLRVYLKGKFPLKGDREVGRILEQRAKGDVAEEEWTDIIKYMYVRSLATSAVFVFYLLATDSSTLFHAHTPLPLLVVNQVQPPGRAQPHRHGEGPLPAARQGGGVRAARDAVRQGGRRGCAARQQGGGRRVAARWRRGAHVYPVRVADEGATAYACCCFLHHLRHRCCCCCCRSVAAEDADRWRRASPPARCCLLLLLLDAADCLLTDPPAHTHTRPPPPFPPPPRTGAARFPAARARSLPARFPGLVPRRGQRPRRRAGRGAVPLAAAQHGRLEGTCADGAAALSPFPALRRRPLADDQSLSFPLLTRTSCPLACRTLLGSPARRSDSSSKRWTRGRTAASRFRRP